MTVTGSVARILKPNKTSCPKEPTDSSGYHSPAFAWDLYSPTYRLPLRPRRTPPSAVHKFILSPCQYLPSLDHLLQLHLTPKIPLMMLLGMHGPNKTPMQSLSVQSFHNDSPPFTGLTDRNTITDNNIPPLDLLDAPDTRSHSSTPEENAIPLLSEQQLNGLNFTTASKQSSPKSPAHSNSVRSTRPPTPDDVFRAKYQLNNGGRVSGHTSPALNVDLTFATLAATSQERILEPDAEASVIPRGGSPIDLQQEALNYSFPNHRLATKLQDEEKIPLVIVACGSFSPPTYLHLRMFEMAKDSIDEGQKYEIIGGYYSPVSDFYKKAGLAPAIHRVRMCELAVDQTSTWLMVDPWEASQPEYQRTAVVLEHFDEHLNQKLGGVTLTDGSKKKIKIVLLAGGDLIESMGEPGVWSDVDLHIILGRFGCLIVERTGSDVWAFLLSHDILYRHRRNIIVVKQLIYNDISSTKVRLFVRRGMSIKYLLPNSVIQYINDHELYRGPDLGPHPDSMADNKLT